MSEKNEKKIETAKYIERQLNAENERSKKNARRVAVAASLLSLCLGAAICVLVPLKE
ncbi:type IV secretion system protein [Salmonella enterica]|uniref:type IV secretion system protein n=1 Tax=Salmonella enterica TaxID=28901 RepID=UPI001CB75F2F|nr:type IV secretion system protein [Salmonella enterica]